MNLSATRALLREAASRHPAVLVAFSGGKDSLVVADLCLGVFKHVEGYCMVLLHGLRIAEEPARVAAERMGIKVHFVEHYLTSNYRKYGAMRFADIKHIGDRVRKQVHVEEELRAATGIDLIAYGHRQSDSTIRRAMLRKLRPYGYDVKNARIYPVWDWKTDEVLAYLRARKIPLPPRVGHDGQHGTSGLSLTEPSVAWIKEHAPDDYQRLEREFPFLGVWAARRRFAPADAPAEVQDGAAGPAHDPGSTVQPPSD